MVRRIETQYTGYGWFIHKSERMASIASATERRESWVLCQANELLKDSELSPIAKRIGERIASHFDKACIIMVLPPLFSVSAAAMV